MDFYLSGPDEHVVAVANPSARIIIRPGNRPNWSIVIENTGANPITSVTAAEAPNGFHYGDDTASIGAIPAGRRMTVQGHEECVGTVRFTLNCAAPTTVDVSFAPSV